MTITEDKERKTFSLSKAVVAGLAKHIARQVAAGERKSSYGAESEIVEQALRMILCLDPVPARKAVDDNE